MWAQGWYFWWFSAGGCPVLLWEEDGRFTLSIHLHNRWNLGAHAPSWATLQWGWSPMVEGFGTPGLTGTSNWPDELLWRLVILIVCLRKWVGWSVDACLLTKSNWFLWKMFEKPVWFTARFFPLLSLFFPLFSSSPLPFSSGFPLSHYFCFTQADTGLVHRLVHIDQPILKIPNICIHLARDIHNSFAPNKENHMYIWYYTGVDTLVYTEDNQPVMLVGLIKYTECND